MNKNLVLLYLIVYIFLYFLNNVALHILLNNIKF
jgi:hypothetical protein